MMPPKSPARQLVLAQHLDGNGSSLCELERLLRKRLGIEVRGWRVHQVAHGVHRRGDDRGPVDQRCGVRQRR